MLRNAIVVGLILGGIGLLVWQKQAEHTTEYTAPMATTTVAAPEPQYPEEWLKEAEAAAEAVIAKKKLEQRQAELETEITVLQAELDEVEKEITVLQAELDEVEKELGVY